MSWLPSKVGAERKKVMVLGGLLVALIAVYFINSGPDIPEQAATAPAAAPAPVKSLPARTSPTPSNILPPQRTGGGRQNNAGIQDFKPSLKLPEGFDVSRIDPSLKLDLLARLQDLPSEGGERSLFEFGAAPKPKTPTPTVDPVKPKDPPAADAAKPTAAASTDPAKPPPPPAIPLKFYGYVGDAGDPSKRAFFLEGEDIIVAGENDVIHNRYKIVRIGVNSAVIEDTVNKNQQTLPLIQELAG